MATYNVTKDSVAPKEAKAGDYIVTGGGTYQVLDPSKYAGMNANALKSAGVSYNPMSGLYSTKVNKVTPSDVNLIGYDTAKNWLSEADKSVSAQLDSAYQKNLSSLSQKYNSNKSDLNNQISDTKAAYLENMMANQEDAYTNAKNALYGAEARGMMNSAQGQAMTNSMLWDSSKEQGSLRRERDQTINNIKSQINTLTQNYNLGLTELEKSKLADELSGMSDNKLKYLESLMGIDQYNADALNAANQEKLNRDFQMKMAMMSSGGGSYGGYGGYGGNSYTKNNGATTESPDLEALSSYVKGLYPMYAKDIDDKMTRINAGLYDSGAFMDWMAKLVAMKDNGLVVNKPNSKDNVGSTGTGRYTPPIYDYRIK